MKTIAEVQAAMDDLARRMSAKCLSVAKAEFRIESGVDGFVWITWAEYPDNEYKSFRTGSIDSQCDEARAWIDGLPSAHEAHRAKFLKLAGAAADYAATHLPEDDIAAEVRATIVSGMKRMSENAITHEAQK